MILQKILSMYDVRTQSAASVRAIEVISFQKRVYPTRRFTFSQQQQAPVYVEMTEAISPKDSGSTVSNHNNNDNVFCR